jgi:hypothetical protein
MYPQMMACALRIFCWKLQEWLLSVYRFGCAIHACFSFWSCSMACSGVSHRAALPSGP